MLRVAVAAVPDANSNVALNPSPTAPSPFASCGPNGVPLFPSSDDPIEATLNDMRRHNNCNQPQTATAKTTFTTFGAAREMVRAQGGFIPAGPWADDTRVWLVEMQGMFYPTYIEASHDIEQPQTPTYGTWFAVASAPPSLPMCCFVSMVPDTR